MDVLIGLIAAFHVYVFVLESFLWKTAVGRKAFDMTVEKAETTYQLAVNQGVYNLFLAAGLVWSLFANDSFADQLQIFFLSCVVLAAVVGGLTVSKRILLVQGLPALVALVLVCLR